MEAMKERIFPYKNQNLFLLLKFIQKTFQMFLLRTWQILLVTLIWRNSWKINPLTEFTRQKTYRNEITRIHYDRQTTSSIQLINSKNFGSIVWTPISKMSKCSSNILFQSNLASKKKSFNVQLPLYRLI